MKLRIQIDDDYVDVECEDLVGASSFLYASANHLSTLALMGVDKPTLFEVLKCKATRELDGIILTKVGKVAAAQDDPGSRGRA